MKQKKVSNYSNRTEAVGDFRTEYEYNRYGNLVYRYEYAANLVDLVFGVNKPSLVVYKTKYEYENGKIIWAILFENDILKSKIKCVYDSEQKLVEEKAYNEDDQAVFEIKYHYDGNRLYSTNIESDYEVFLGKTKYEYNPAGQLIRKYKFGSDMTMCRPLDIFAN